MIWKQRESGKVGFVLELETAETPHVVGAWDGWCLPGVPMVRQRGKPPIWKAAVTLPPGEHQFRYRIGDCWFNDPSADKYVDNGLGSDNSVVVVEEAATKIGRSHAPRSRAASEHPGQ